MTDLDQTSDTTSRRHSKARERQRRRRERRGESQTLDSPVRRRSARQRASKQLAPLDEKSFDLSALNTPLIRFVILGAAALLFMGAVIVAVGMFKNDPLALDPNALWIGDQWTYRENDDEQIRVLVDRLREHQMGAVFARVSELNVDLTWTGRLNGLNRFPEVEADVKRFVEQMQDTYPNLTLYGTVSVRSDLGGDAEDRNRLDEPETQRAVADFSKRVVDELGFDGVLLDVRPVLDGDDGFIGLVRQVRRTLGDDALLAVAVPPDWTPEGVDIPMPSVIAPGTAWSRQYKQRLALLQVDLIVVQAYNSYLTDADEYIDWMAYQVEAYAEAVGSLETETDLLIGIPTYADEQPAHDTQVENVRTAIDGVQHGLAAVPDFTDIVRGIAVFAEWDTDDSEWSQIHNLWLE